MKISVEHDVLAEAVSWTARSLPARPAVPILSGVKLVAEGQTLTLSSFDYEVSARIEVPAVVDIPGEVVVPGRMLADISRELPAKTVNLELTDNKVAIKCGASRFQMITMPVDDYPVLPAFPPVIGKVDAASLANSVNQVSPAASKDDTLPPLTGILMEIEGEELSLLATDRYRLAAGQLEWTPAQSDASTSALVKAKILAEVAKSMTSAGDIEIALDQGEASIIGFSVAGRTMTSQLQSGDYPPVRKLFPESSAISAVVGTEELIDSVRRVSLVSGHNSAIRFTFSSGKVLLESSLGGDYEAEESINCHLEGDEITISFNGNYLLEGLKAVKTPYVKLAFNDSTKAAVMTSMEKIDGPENESFKYLIMPIRAGA